MRRATIVEGAGRMTKPRRRDDRAAVRDALAGTRRVRTGARFAAWFAGLTGFAPAV